MSEEFAIEVSDELAAKIHENESVSDTLVAALRCVYVRGSMTLPPRNSRSYRKGWDSTLPTPTIAMTLWQNQSLQTFSGNN
jgi:hypothetical protein